MKSSLSLLALAIATLASAPAHADAGTMYVGAINGAMECMIGAVAVGSAGHIAAIHLAPKAHDALTIGGGVVGCAAGAGLAYQQYKEYADEAPPESQLRSEGSEDASE